MRKPELVVGVLIMVVCALGAVMWHLRSVDRSPALAVASSIERGETIDDGDIRVVFVATDDAVTHLDDSQRSAVVGSVALVDLTPGTLITSSVVADQPTLEDGEGIVGLALDPGGYPAMGIAPGDRVDVVRTLDAGAVGDSSEEDPEGGDGEGTDPAPDTPVIATGATVVAVEELSSERMLVSIQAPAAAAQAVAAAGSGAVRLVQVPA